MVEASQLAHRYDEYLVVLHAALARRRQGLGRVRTFMEWVEGYWREDVPQEPTAPPVAVSAGGWGVVRWHEGDGLIRGYVPGLSGGYEVPIDAAPPAVGGRDRYLGVRLGRLGR